MTEEGGERASW